MSDQLLGALGELVSDPLAVTMISLDRVREYLRLARLRRRMFSTPPRTSGTEQWSGHRIRINDGPNFYMLCKDVFVNRIYHFTARRQDPLIIDCGSNIGVPILYFKGAYPNARIIAFEPDPTIVPYLRENIAGNRLQGVEVVHAAVAGREGTLTFWSDGICGSYLADERPAHVSPGWKRFEVQCVRLRDYLTAPVDFLKMNIEGAEWEVLADSEDRLREIDQIIIEYHHLPGLPRTLHRILDLLDRQGFEFMINDFDGETNPDVRPPFTLTPESRYFLLIYARRRP